LPPVIYSLRVFLMSGRVIAKRIASGRKQEFGKGFNRFV
jgi:hypothetical protein